MMSYGTCYRRSTFSAYFKLSFPNINRGERVLNGNSNENSDETQKMHSNGRNAINSGVSCSQT